MPLNIKDLDPSKIEEVKPASSKLNIADLDPSKLEVVSEGVAEEPGFLSAVGSTAAKGLGAVADFMNEYIDPYTGAPVRAARAALLKDSQEQQLGPDTLGTEPTLSFPTFKGIASAGKAAYDQFGKDSATAPTGKEISKSQGYSAEETIDIPIFSRYFGKVSPAGMHGLAMDIVTDPLNLVPGATVAKGAGKAIGGTFKAAVKGADVVSDLGAKVIGAAKPVGAIKRVGKAGGEAVARTIDHFWNHKISPDFDSLKGIAEKNGIDIANAPEAVEFGKESLISRKGRNIAEGPGGQARLEAHRKFLTDTTDAFDNKLDQIAGGKPVSRVDAGNQLRDAYLKSTDALFNAADTTYTQVVRNNPGLMISDKAAEGLSKGIDDIEKYATSRLARKLTPEQTQQARMLLNATKVAKGVDGSVEQAVDALRNIGEVAFKETPIGRVPPDVVKTRELYFNLREAIYDSVEKGVNDGGQTISALKRSNEMISDFLKKSKALDDTIRTPGLAPELIFERMTKNTAQINALREVLHPNDFAKLRSAYIDTFVPKSSDGIIRFPSLANLMRSKNHKDIVESMFTGDPQTLAEIKELISLGESAGIDVLSTSGTGASQKFNNMREAIQAAGSDEAALQVLKERARAGNRGLKLPKQPLFGPAAISRGEISGLRIPLEFGRQRANQEKEEREKPGLRLPGGR